MILFALAVFSKESAAAFAALPLAFPQKRARSRDSWLAGTGAAVIIGMALVVHNALSRSSQIPAIDNPTALVDGGQRVLTALWVQCLYLSKALVPIVLSADYSYKQIRLVMGLDDWRAWAGLALGAGALYLAWRRREFRPAVFAYAILFSPTANIVFPIGTIMGERLLYAPSLGLALLLATLLARSRHWKTVLIAVALLFAARTAVRNVDWLDAQRFYTKLVKTSPDSAKSYYSIGVELRRRTATMSVPSRPTTGPSPSFPFMPRPIAIAAMLWLDWAGARKPWPATANVCASTPPTSPLTPTCESLRPVTP